MVVVTDDEDLARERKEHKCGASADDREECLYWVAIQQIPPEPLDEYSAAAETTVMRYYNSYGEIVQEEDDILCYYECRHPPCTKIERELREFSICGRCQVKIKIWLLKRTIHFLFFFYRRLDIAAPIVNSETGRIIKSTAAKGEDHSQ